MNGKKSLGDYPEMCSSIFILPRRPSAKHTCSMISGALPFSLLANSSKQERKKNLKKIEVIFYSSSEFNRMRWSMLPHHTITYSWSSLTQFKTSSTDRYKESLHQSDWVNLNIIFYSFGPKSTIEKDPCLCRTKENAERAIVHSNWTDLLCMVLPLDLE